VSERYLASADVVLACAEDSRSLTETATIVSRSSRAPILSVLTKSDLVSHRDEKGSPSVVRVSAETGAGLQELLRAIDKMLDARHGEIPADLPILTSARHQKAISTALSEVEQFTMAWKEGKLPATVAAVHLRTAIHALEELIGAVEVEDVLDRVFSSFCVGK
jgi:tRNA modification GTPase